MSMRCSLVFAEDLYSSRFKKLCNLVVREEGIYALSRGRRLHVTSMTHALSKDQAWSSKR